MLKKLAYIFYSKLLIDFNQIFNNNVNVFTSKITCLQRSIAKNRFGIKTNDAKGEEQFAVVIV